MFAFFRLVTSDTGSLRLRLKLLLSDDPGRILANPDRLLSSRVIRTGLLYDLTSMLMTDLVIGFLRTAGFILTVKDTLY
ncbi:unnamed protein product [Schistocephalus solidus]|uniref:YggT family protein n=1 Tax=Schistocephalus solidus TaxID=70667 RepID=A0A183T664_SCHSO|nr:unnamed protein product [Schistocephalus solidus]